MTYDGRLIADARYLPIADETVQCCVTSPPYWGQRVYLNHPQEIGIEATPELYCDAIVAALEEVRRVLRSDGTLWLVIGDRYARDGGKVEMCPGGGEKGKGWLQARRNDGAGSGTPNRAVGDERKVYSYYGPVQQQNRLPQSELKPKDLLGLPWMVAFALRSAGWYLRRDIVWAKRNPMVESVLDRPTGSHEFIFLLSKSRKYFYDAAAIAEPSDPKSGRDTSTSRRAGRPDTGFKAGRRFETRNKRDVWTTSTACFSGPHNATFPETIAETCIRAGSKPGDLVLDPFFGSGTVGRVAERLSRRWIGSDLGYQELQRKRLQSVQKFLELGYRSDDEDDHTGDDQQPDCYENHLAE